MSAVSAIVRPRPDRLRRARALWFVPFVLLLAAAVLANLGIATEQKAVAATDSVTVTATVASSLAVADQCATAGALGISVTLGAHSAGSCAIQFGSTNDSSVTLRGAASTTPFITSFANEGAICANLSAVDEAGLKIVSVGASVTKAWPCATGAVADNTLTSYAGLTTTAANLCTTGALGTTLECTVGVGVFEAGSDLAPGSYTGTLNLDVIA